MALICPVHKKEAKSVPAGIRKDGTKYPAFQACPEYGCREKVIEGVALDEQEPLDQVLERDIDKQDWDAKERRVIRQNSWRHATQLVVSNSSSLSEDLKTNLKAAKVLAHEIEEDIYRED